MDPVITIMIAACVGAIALVFGVGSILQSRRGSQAESRLAAFTGGKSQIGAEIADEIVRDGLASASGLFGQLAARFKNLPMFFQQAESPLRPEHFVALCGGTAALGGFAYSMRKGDPMV